MFWRCCHSLTAIGLADHRSSRVVRFHRWQANDELAPRSGSVAVRLDRAVVQLHQLTHERETKAEPAHRAIARPVDLNEGFEDSLEHVRRNPDPVVLDTHDDPSIFLFDGEMNASADIAVFGGVVQEIGHELREPHCVAAYEQRCERNVRGKGQAAAGNERSTGLDCPRDDRDQIDRLQVNFDRSASDA